MKTPGDFLKEILTEHAWTQTMFAQMINRPLKTINELIKGKIHISARMALELEQITGIEAIHWMIRDANYQIEKQKAKNVSATFDPRHPQLHGSASDQQPPAAPMALRD